MKLLIIGHARHGKDTVAEMIFAATGLTHTSSSEAASRVFIYDILKDKYNYKDERECFEDRINHRAEWYELICNFNKEDRAKLAKNILQWSDIYVGMRDYEEIQECRNQGIFDLTIGVWDKRKDEEHKDSFNIDIWKESDIIIPNNGNLEELRTKVLRLVNNLK